MARFSIRDLLLITAVVALATGWFVERRQLNVARINAESESAKHKADRAAFETQWLKREREFQQLADAIGEYGVQVYFRNGRAVVSPDSAFADDPLKIVIPSANVGTATSPHSAANE